MSLSLSAVQTSINYEFAMMNYLVEWAAHMNVQNANTLATN